MPMIRTWSRVALPMLAGLVCVPAAHAQSTIFRVSDMDLRDPHVYIDFIGCRDLTDTPLAGYSVNGELQLGIQTDGDGDGYLDFSTLVEFLPLNQSQSTNLMDSGSAQCTAPMASTQCGPILFQQIAGDAALFQASQCLTFHPGTARPYTPAITSTGAPCFVSPVGTLNLDLGGIPLTLHDAEIAATFVGLPAQTLVNGLLRGFISEAEANATILPASFPLVGGQPLSALLPGGTNNCAAHSDLDINGGVSGWWFYLNFTAARVASDLFADGFSDGFE